MASISFASEIASAASILNKCLTSNIFLLRVSLETSTGWVAPRFHPIYCPNFQYIRRNGILQVNSPTYLFG